MKKEMGLKLIPSTGEVKKHGGKGARSSLGPGGRFIFEGEWKNPERNTRKALVTVKDLKSHQIEGKLYYLYLIMIYLILILVLLLPTTFTDICKYIIPTNINIFAINLVNILNCNEYSSSS